MLYDSGFNNAAKRIVGYDLKLTNLFKNGRIDEKTFREKKSQVYEKLSILKKNNIGLIDRYLSSMEDNKERLKQQHEKGGLSDSQYEILVSDIEQRSGELNAERNLLELCDNEGYLAYLNEQLDFYGMRDEVKKSSFLDYTRGPKVVVEAEATPPWATVTAFLIIVFVGFMSLLSGSILTAVMNVALVCIAFALGAIIFHFATTVAAIEDSTIEKAFACFVGNVMLNIVGNVALGFVILTWIFVFKTSADSGLALLTFLMRAMVLLVTAVAVTKRVYRTTWSKTFIAVALQIVIAVAVTFVLFTVFTIGLITKLLS
ncbi:MAG: hypothetical protein V1703_01590 [Candidatus Altiarchaeota archaeon]